MAPEQRYETFERVSQLKPRVQAVAGPNIMRCPALYSYSQGLVRPDTAWI